MYQARRVICPKCKNKIDVPPNQTEIICNVCGHRGGVKIQSQPIQQPSQQYQPQIRPQPLQQQPIHMQQIRGQQQHQQPSFQPQPTQPSIPSQSQQPSQHRFMQQPMQPQQYSGQFYPQQQIQPNQQQEKKSWFFRKKEEPRIQTFPQPQQYQPIDMQQIRGQQQHQQPSFQPQPTQQVPIKRRCPRCFTDANIEDIYCIECGTKI